MMDKYYGLGGKQYNSSQTKSDTFYMQSARSRQDDINEWITLVKSQNTRSIPPPQKKEKFAWKHKAPLPEIGERSPRFENTSPQPLASPKNNLKSLSFQSDIPLRLNNSQNIVKDDFEDQGYSKYEPMKSKDFSSLSSRSLVSRSMDMFPTHVPRKASRLRPLDQLTAVQEARGPSAFHHLPPMMPDNLLERPSAPTPYLSPRFEQPSVSHIPGCVTPAQRGIYGKSPPTPPACPSTTPEPTPPATSNPADVVSNGENIPPDIPNLDLEKLDSKTTELPADSSNIADASESMHGFIGSSQSTDNKENTVSDSNHLAQGTIIEDSVDDRSFLQRSNRPKSARKRRAPQRKDVG